MQALPEGFREKWLPRKPRPVAQTFVQVRLVHARSSHLTSYFTVVRNTHPSPQLHSPHHLRTPILLRTASIWVAPCRSQRTYKPSPAGERKATPTAQLPRRPTEQASSEVRGAGTTLVFPPTQREAGGATVLGAPAGCPTARMTRATASHRGDIYS